MGTNTLNVPNISCCHCIIAIQSKLNGLEGVSRVIGNPDKKKVTVEWKFPTTLDQIKATLKDLSYPPAE